MKRGLLLYTPEDAQRNRWFIEQLCLNAEPEGLSLRLSLTDDPETRTRLRNETDFLINRSRQYAHSMYAEGVRKIPCFNSARVTGITNQKYLTYALLHGHYGIPMAQTWQFSRKTPLPELTFPLVAKPADEVYRISRELCEQMKPYGGFILAPGCDLAPNIPPENLQAMARAAREA